MSGYSRENPDEPEFDVDKFFDKVEERRERARLAELADTQTPDEIRSESLNAEREDLDRAEIESGSEWEQEGGDDE